ncbi:MAG: hypothetical protein RL701_6124 [Pseudomonadota bacterium]|jgi:hypothetical protein
MRAAKPAQALPEASNLARTLQSTAFMQRLRHTSVPTGLLLSAFACLGGCASALQRPIEPAGAQAQHAPVEASVRNVSVHRGPMHETMLLRRLGPTTFEPAYFRVGESISEPLHGDVTVPVARSTAKPVWITTAFETNAKAPALREPQAEVRLWSATAGVEALAKTGSKCGL